VVSVEFAQIIPQSFDYWKGIPALVAFASGKALCGYEKDYPAKLRGDDVEKELVRTGFGVKAVVITGAEPCAQKDVPIFCKKMRLKNKKVRVRTSGAHYGTLEKMINRKVVNYVELSLKAPLYEDSYKKVCDIDFSRVRKSLWLLADSKVEHEFSVTWSPELAADDIRELAGQVGEEAFVIEAFEPGECADAKYNSLPATEYDALKALASSIKGPKEVRIRFSGKEELA
jgi:pyruvate-formate lyase-activating enzyme